MNDTWFLRKHLYTSLEVFALYDKLGNNEFLHSFVLPIYILQHYCALEQYICLASYVYNIIFISSIVLPHPHQCMYYLVSQLVVHYILGLQY